MAFRVGQKVVCVDDIPEPGTLPDLPVNRGGVYTIRWLGIFAGKPCLRLVECLRPDSVPEPDRPMRQDRFRPVVERKTDISIFTAMLDPSRQKISA